MQGLVNSLIELDVVYAGHAVDQDGVAPAAFNATIATALGLPLEEIVKSPQGRPFKVAHDGKPVEKLLT